MRDIFSRKEWTRETSLTKEDLSESFKQQLEIIDREFNSIYTPYMIAALARFAEYDVIQEDPDLLTRLKKVIMVGKASAHELRYGKIEGQRRKKEHIEKTRHTEENFIKRYGEKEGKKKYKEYCKSKSHSLENYIRRHGEEEGKKKYKEYWENTNFSTSIEAFMRRHGNEDGQKKHIEFCEKMSRYFSGELCEDKEKYKEMVKRRSKSIAQNDYPRDNNSLQSCIKRYGESEGLIRYKQLIKKQKENNDICIEKWLKLGFSEKDAKVIVKNKQAERTVKCGKASKISLVFFEKFIDALKKEFKIEDNDYYIGVGNSKEYYINNKGKIFLYDFAVPKLNLIVEFHGICFHPKTPEDNIELFPFFETQQQVQEALEKDQLKKWVALERNFFNYFTVFEDENYEDTITNIMTSLKENKNV